MITARPPSRCLSSYLLLLLSFVYLNSVQCQLPDLSKTSREPVITVAKSDAYLSCKVDSLGDNTVIFKRIDSKGNGRILTAAQLTVTSDKRFSTLHERRHSTWLLRIQNTTIADSGLYICEVSSNPPVRIPKLLKVLPAIGLINRSNSSISSEDKSENDSGWPPISLQELSHNYTDCCASNGVPNSCFEYCEFGSLLARNRMQSGGPVHSPACWKHIGSIARCLADGRNHAPCCERQQVPGTCASICRGEFTADKVRDYFTCADYVAPVLACVAQGIRTLPPPPQELRVTAYSDVINIEWNRPKLDGELIEQYQLNVTQLHGFDEPGTFVRDRVINERDSSTVNNDPTQPPSLIGMQLSIKLSANQTQFNVTNLKPFTVYEVTMKSLNRIGQSLPSETVRVVTRLNETSNQQDARIPTLNPTAGELVIPASNKTVTDKQLPDMRKCCIDRGVKLDRCVDVLCDPTRADEASLADLMICAPWANITFSCLAQGVDHRPCCSARGVPDNCGNFCDGSVKRLDFRHFVCVQHMSSYQSCVLQHYDVLPGAPTDFHLTSVHANWAVFRWKNPIKNYNNITSFHLHYRRRFPGESASQPPAPFEVIETVQSPFLLDTLEPNARYEVWVAASNKYGLGTPSARLIFSTPPAVSDESEEESSDPSASGLVENKPILTNNGTGIAYNETSCCLHANVSSACMPLCTYDVKVQDVLRLGTSCAEQLPALVRCGSGGRNHIPCCQRRGVQESCLNLCAGIVDTSPLTAANRCSSSMGKILQCMEEGTGFIPGQPKDLRAIKVTNSSIQLLWQSADEDKDNTAITYQVRYGKVDLSKPLHPLDHEHTQNSSSPMALLANLEPEHTYSIYVLAGNSYGVSLPSLVLLVNTSQAEGLLRSVVGPPHALELMHQSTDTLTFSWLPPLFIPPDCIISYIVHYRPVNGTELRFLPNNAANSSSSSSSSPTSSDNGWIRVSTRFNTMIITNLTYNTQYAFAVQARVTFRNETSKLANESLVPTISASRRRVQTSVLSETLLVWTDPAIPASVNLPLIIPSGGIIEGQNATALCIASGTPMPTLSIYVDGLMMKRAERRHLTYTITNITRNVSTITCYAINGYGQDMQSSQSTLELKVKFPPSVSMSTGDDQVTSALNSTARLQCQVSGNPQPIVTWHRQTLSTSAVELGDNVDVISSPHNELPFTWINTLLIKNLDSQHTGKYLCEAVNFLGKTQKVLQLNVDTNRINDRNYTDCCEREQVSPKCMKVCHFDIDIQLATTIPECYKDLDKLMFCAADGSDHRQCCRRNQVPPGCVQWCRGTKSHSALKEQSAAYCALAASPTIVKCFQEGSALLPGPVHKLRLLRFSASNGSALVDWSPPEKNPELVQFYRVYYRPIGSKDLVRNTTNSTQFELTHLDSNKLYEFVVKAGNSFGLSIFSEPVVVASNISTRIRPDAEAADLQSSSTSGISRFLFNLLAALACVSLLLFGAYYTYDRFSYKIKPPPGSVAFENPTYMKDTNQVMLNDVHHLDTINNNQVGVQSNQNVVISTSDSSNNPNNSSAFTEFKDLLK